MSEARPKTPKELEKEKKKAEKLAKFQAKQAKQAPAGQQPAAGKAKDKKAKEKEVVPEFVDTTKPGEKKVLVSLDDPSLKAYNPKSVESSWYSWWKREGFFKPQYTTEGNIKPEGRFVIPAPPPNVTGALHIGHALTIAIQDALIRFNRMRGKTTLFLPGFDHAGISTQSVVEKMLWKQEGKTRHDLGREKFVGLVWEWKEEYHERIRKQLEALGASYDWDYEVFTMDAKRTEAVTEAFVQLFDDGTLYRAERLVNWCTALRTTLSNLELENKDIPGRTGLKVPGYDEPVEFGVLTSFAYPVVGSDEKLIVATTRPETVFGDSAVAVHPEDPRYKHLHGKRVRHPLLDRELPIVTDSDAVDMEFGTGAVKITPAHDQNDYETGKRHNLEFINIMTEEGILNENCGPEYTGMKRFDARPRVIEALKKLGLFVEQTDNPMTIPTCAKSGDVIEPLLKPQWWVSQKEQAQQAMEAVRSGELTITPKTSENDFFSWMGNIQDWCISRQLWWGHRCPAYIVTVDGVKGNPSTTESWVAGRTEEEALNKARARWPNAKDIRLEQDEDVLDTWFSSGLWPFSTLGWPKVDSVDLAKFYPMDLLETGWDILFFWVARMVMLGIKLTGKSPFREVYCHSLVRDAQGRKMSKSLGNVIDPLDVISGISLDGLHQKLLVGNLDPREVAKAKEGQRLSYPNGIPECGTDALRFALCAYSTGGRDINLDILRVEGYRKFGNKIYQATKFALMRLGPDYKPPTHAPTLEGKSLVEKWILHKFSAAAKEAAHHLDARQFSEATHAIYQFWLYELCDIYIENSKPLIMDGTPQERQSAQDTLYTCLDGALRLIHPFMPFLTEELWQRLPVSGPRPDTIALTSWPELNLFDTEAEQAYNLVLDVVRNARSLMGEYGIVKDGEIILSAAGSSYVTVDAQQQSILALVRQAGKLTVTQDESTPAGCVVAAVSPECRVFVVVKGYVDLDQEIAKAHAQRAKITKSQANLIKQTQIEGYETKVRDVVREQNARRLEQYEAELKSLDAVTAEFERLKL